MQTAHGAGELLGWTVITHPFHPLRGQRFRVVKLRKLCGQPTLILETAEGGTFGVPEDWTDRAMPANQASPRLLAAPALLELVRLVQDLKGRRPSQTPGPKGGS